MHVRHVNTIGRIIQKVNATDVVNVEQQTINNDVLSLVFKTTISVNPRNGLNINGERKWYGNYKN